MIIGKPARICVQVQDRQRGVYKTITVYGMTHEEVMAEVRRALAAKGRRRRR